MASIASDVTAFVGATGSVLGLGGIAALAILALIRVAPELKKLTNEDNSSLRESLMGRIEKLEQDLADEREARRKEAAKWEAENRILRHELANMTQGLEGLIMLMRANPATVLDNIELIETRIKEGRERIAMEKGEMFTQARKGGE